MPSVTRPSCPTSARSSSASSSYTTVPNSLITGINLPASSQIWHNDTLRTSILFYLSHDQIPLRRAPTLTRPNTTPRQEFSIGKHLFNVLTLNQRTFRDVVKLLYKVSVPLQIWDNIPVGGRLPPEHVHVWSVSGLCDEPPALFKRANLFGIMMLARASKERIAHYASSVHHVISDGYFEEKNLSPSALKSPITLQHIDFPHLLSIYPNLKTLEMVLNHQSPNSQRGISTYDKGRECYVKFIRSDDGDGMPHFDICELEFRYRLDATPLNNIKDMNLTTGIAGRKRIVRSVTVDVSRPKEEADFKPVLSFFKLKRFTTVSLECCQSLCLHGFRMEADQVRDILKTVPALKVLRLTMVENLWKSPAERTDRVKSQTELLRNVNTNCKQFQERSLSIEGDGIWLIGIERSLDILTASLPRLQSVSLPIPAGTCQQAMTVLQELSLAQPPAARYPSIQSFHLHLQPRTVDHISSGLLALYLLSLFPPTTGISALIWRHSEMDFGNMNVHAEWEYKRNLSVGRNLVRGMEMEMKVMRIMRENGMRSEFAGWSMM